MQRLVGCEGSTNQLQDLTHPVVEVYYLISLSSSCCLTFFEFPNIEFFLCVFVLRLVGCKGSTNQLQDLHHPVVEVNYLSSLPTSCCQMYSINSVRPIYKVFVNHFIMRFGRCCALSLQRNMSTSIPD